MIGGAAGGDGDDSGMANDGQEGGGSFDDALPRERRLPLTDRLSPRHGGYARVLAAHEAAMRAGAPGYVDPLSGFFVFTAQELWDRGHCCHSGCRHCPYDDGPRGPQGLPAGV